jgi:alanine racemase
VLRRATYAQINVTAAIDNFRTMSALAINSKTLAVIKADAYGHGAIAIAEALSGDAEGFAVAFIDEAMHLREHGIVAAQLSSFTAANGMDKSRYRYAPIRHWTS